jgi:hypothetical protein
VLKSSGVLFCQEAKEYYRAPGPGNLSRRTEPEMLTSTYRAHELCAKRLLDIEDSTRTRKACAAHYHHFIYNIYPEMPELVRKAEKRIEELGGSQYRIPRCHYPYQLLVDVLGWKAARRLHKLASRFR